MFEQEYKNDRPYAMQSEDVEMVFLLIFIFSSLQRRTEKGKKCKTNVCLQ